MAQNSANYAFGLLEKYGVTGVSQDFVNQWFTIIYDELVFNPGFMPTIIQGVKEALKALKAKGLPLAVVSAHSRSVLIREAKEYGIDHLFEVFEGWSSQEKAHSLLRACRHIHVNPRQAAYFADTVYDIQSAKKAGLISVAVSTGYNPYEILALENPDLLVRSLQEFVDKIEV